MVRTESPTGLVILAGLGWACAYAAVALAWAAEGDDALARCALFGTFGWVGGSACAWLRLRFDHPRPARNHVEPPPMGAPVVPVSLGGVGDSRGAASEPLDTALATDAAPLVH